MPRDPNLQGKTGRLTADGTCFPPTRSDVLRKAAAGDWPLFLAAYLRPCWREVQIVCRQKGVALEDADDLFQELILRLYRPGRAKRQAVATVESAAHGNIPARYLQGRDQGMFAARFRTYLQRTILNLVREHLRARYARREQVLENRLDEIVPDVELILSETFDGRWFADAILSAVSQLRDESKTASSKAKRRQYAILRSSITSQATAETIALHAGLSRSTVAEILTSARTRLVALLKQSTGIADSAELKRLLKQNPVELVRAFQRVAP